jgi:hypothetical protein
MSGTCKNCLLGWCLGVADDAGFMDVFAGKTDFSDGGWSDIFLWNITFVSVPTHFAPFLRSIIFVGESALGTGFDFENHLRTTDPVKSARQRAAASA